MLGPEFFYSDAFNSSFSFEVQQTDDLKVLCLAWVAGLFASDRFEWDLEGGWF